MTQNCLHLQCLHSSQAEYIRLLQEGARRRLRRHKTILVTVPGPPKTAFTEVLTTTHRVARSGERVGLLYSSNPTCCVAAWLRISCFLFPLIAAPCYLLSGNVCFFVARLSCSFDYRTYNTKVVQPDLLLPNPKLQCSSCSMSLVHVLRIFS